MEYGWRSQLISLRFGVELEVVGRPRTIRHKPQHYYADLANSLRATLPYFWAVPDMLDQRYRKHPEHYDKWFITKDGSLGNPPGSVPLEAVSPILSARGDWVAEIAGFWGGWDVTFDRAETSDASSTHVHISPENSNSFSLAQLRQLAFGAIIYEPLILATLPHHRRNNIYCQPNTAYATALRQTLSCLQGICSNEKCDAIWRTLQSQGSKEELCNFMQHGNEHDRRVLWNFENTCGNKSGTVEFRGAPGVTNSRDTITWILFAIGFVHMCLYSSMFELKRGSEHMDTFWYRLRLSVGQMGFDRHFPPSWINMPVYGVPHWRGLSHKSDKKKEDSDSSSDGWL